MTQPETPTSDTTAPDPRDLDRLRATTPRCSHCGGWHLRACPRVRTLTYHTSGQLASVTFWKRWPTDHVLFDDEPENGGDVA